MLSFKKILVPYDGSSYAKKALATAADLALLIPGAKLFIATVTPAEEPKEKVRLTSASADDTPKKNPGTVLLEEAEALLPKGVPHETILRAGDAGDELVTLTLQKEFDLIVMGSRGRGALKSLLMGSVSSHLASNSKCTILIVK